MIPARLKLESLFSNAVATPRIASAGAVNLDALAAYLSVATREHIY